MGKLKTPLLPDLFKYYLTNKQKEECPRGAHEVRHGTSSIRFHRAVPRSSSHTGPRIYIHTLGARLRDRTATQRSEKGSEKVLERVLGKGSEKGVCYGIYNKKGF